MDALLSFPPAASTCAPQTTFECVAYIECSMVDVAAGTYSSFAVSADGRVEAWGLNNYGQLALPASTAAHHTPNIVSGLLDHKVAAVAGGQHHTLVVTAVSGYRGKTKNARGCCRVAALSGSTSNLRPCCTCLGC